MTTNLSQDIQTFLQKESTKEFLKAAEKFIDIVEADNIQQEQFPLQAHRALVQLYSSGHNLEHIDLIYSSADSDFGKTDDEFFINKNRALISNLGKDCFYWEVFDPAYSAENGEIMDNEPNQGWLVDDFADIYRDLKIELEKMKIGTDEAIEDALWQMKFSFIHHWGNHCINAMRYLHYLWYDGKLSA